MLVPRRHDFRSRAGTAPGHYPDQRGRPGHALREPAWHAGPDRDRVRLPRALQPQLRVTARNHNGMPVLAINCAGGVHAVTAHAPAMEGGIAVAPASFGRYGGDLVAPNETTGRVFAIAPDGAVVTLAVFGRPDGGDIGVESAGFVPAGFGASDSAYLADRFSNGNRPPGTNSILRLPGPELIKAGVRPGDLLVATEGSAQTIVVRCASSCTVRYIAVGPAIAHAEGHIVFTVADQ